MRAMQLVSGSKLKRAQSRLFQARAILEFLDGLLQRVLASTTDLDHPLCTPNPDAPETLVMFTSDTGLCGSYNTNLIQLAEATLRRDTHKRTDIVFIGKKGHRYFTKRGYHAHEAYLDLAGRPNLEKAEMIAKKLLERFLSGQTSAVQVLYSRFLSAMSYKPTLVRWLPIQLDAPKGQQPSTQVEYIFEPSPERIFQDLLPRWVVAKFSLMLLEAFTSEHSARMIAMKNATDNAEELLRLLTLQRNKIRQASITKEISEIVGTAEALK